ncbi:MAG: FAD-dependent oxidoreductase [Candidatus Borkfalkia sp.]
MKSRKGIVYAENIPFGETISSFAGVRAYSDRHDFIIEESDETENLIHVAGIESPGLTSAPAIGEYVAALCAEKFHARRNENFDPMRQRNRFKDLSAEEKNEIIARRPDYGKVVCRCENVTLGEILDALRQNPPARTLDGVKFRTRAGMGRCQGGFCQPSVFNTLMQEYGYRAQRSRKGQNPS